MNGFIKDAKLAVRMLLKRPSFTVAAVIVLALGIGANTAIFSIVYSVLVRPLPFGEPHRLVQLWHTPPQQQFPGISQFSLSAANYLDWEQQNDVFEQSAVYAFENFRLTGNGEPQALPAARVEPTFFSVLRVKPLLGRVISDSDGQGGNEHVVVLSHRLWVTRFASDRDIVGKSIQLDGVTYTVAGVMRPNFVKPEWAELWTPLVWDPQERVVRGEHHFQAVARLKSGVTVPQAQAELSTIAARLAGQYPADNAGWGAQVVPLREDTVGGVREPLMILLGAVAVVLLIACANVANLTFAKTMDRRKEIAIRAALGANHIDIVRQVLTEGIILSTAGGALGLIVAQFGTTLVVEFLGSSLPRLNEIALDGNVLAFTLIVSVLTGTIASAAPAWRMSRSDPNDALKQGFARTDFAAGRKETRRILVVVEVALSVVLLVGAGLLMRTLWNLRNVNPGFDSQRVLTMSIGVASNDFQTEQQEVQFFNGVLQRVRALPGVQAAGVIDDLPLQGGSTQPVAIEGRPQTDMAHQPEVSVRLLSPGFHSALRIPVIRGRDFTDADTASSKPVVLISESMAKQLWPNEDPIGKRLTLTFFPEKVREVVGIVGDIKDRGLDYRDSISTLYWPVTQFYMPARVGKFQARPMQLAVRTANAPEGVTAAIRAAVHEISPAIPLLDIRTMDDRVAESLSPQRFNMFLLASFAGLALLLAGVGIYSVLAYQVRQRVREIGIRMALGANRRDVLRMIVVEGIKPTVSGLLIGVALAVAVGRLLSGLIYGVRETDVPTFVAVSLLVVGVGFIASALPALRATRVDPLRTLHDE